MTRRLIVLFLIFAFVFNVSNSLAQESYPEDNTLTNYHPAPAYRESESHPLRILSYIIHPIGWVLREGITRPLSYFASSSEETRSVMGWRDQYDYRQPECFSADTSTPDCRKTMPFNYNSEEDASADEGSYSEASHAIMFPDVNFDYDKSSLTELGEGQVRRIAQYLMTNSQGVKVVLEGHADARGSSEYNQKLADQRAESVRQELVKVGVPSERLTTVSFGNSKPVFADQTGWAYAVNRRVSVGTEK